jgi:transposase
MLRPADTLTEVYVCVHPVDMRKQIAGLSALVQDELKFNPFDAKLFAFCNRRRTLCRLLYWEKSGFVLWTKKLERERFHWPRSGNQAVQLTGQELNWVLDGLDLTKWRPHERLHYEYVA